MCVLQDKKWVWSLCVSSSYQGWWLVALWITLYSVGFSSKLCASPPSTTGLPCWSSLGCQVSEEWHKNRQQQRQEVKFSILMQGEKRVSKNVVATVAALGGASAWWVLCGYRLAKTQFLMR